MLFMYHLYKYVSNIWLYFYPARPQDLKGLDEDALKFRVAQLAMEMEERTKWKPLRLTEGVKQAEAETGRKVIRDECISV